jgi:hypothetical protein
VSVADSQIVNPARRTASFHHNQIDFVTLEDGRQIVAVGSYFEELVFSSFLIEKAAHSLELANV